jgi:nucleotide-binding universal stress UspA family protein
MDYHIRTILLAADLGARGSEIIRHGAGIASRFGAKLHLIHVIEPPSEYFNVLVASYVPSETMDKLLLEGFATARQNIQEQLTRLCDDLGADSGLIESLQVLEGLPHEVILNESARLNADMVVMGSHSHSALDEMLMGSVAHKVVLRSRVPVLLVPIPQT